MVTNFLEEKLLPELIQPASPVAGALFPAQFPMRRFSVREYELLGQHGILGEDDNVELLEGWIVEKITKNPRHEQVLYRLARSLESRSPSGYLLRNQSPLVTLDSVPEPDLMLVRGKIEDFEERHTQASEVILVIEIADSSLNLDRRKCELYARARVPIYWIVNLADQSVETYSDPMTVEPICYANKTVLSANDTASIHVGEGLVLSIPVREFLLKS